MIYLYTGNPGSGKSMHMAMNIYWQLRNAKPVIANFEIDTDKTGHEEMYKYLDNNELTPAYLMKYASQYFKEHKFKEGAIKLYIDECQILYNSRSWRDTPENKRSEWIKFFTQHRKFGYDVFLVCQFHEMIDKQIRTLVEYEVSHRKVNNVGLFGKFVTLLTFGHSVFVGVTKWYGQKMRLSAEWFIGRKKYYEIYNTLKMFDESLVSTNT